jgi:hypothetical protein
MERDGTWVEQKWTNDDHLQQQIAKAAKKWRAILERVTTTVHSLAQQNLPLRGHRESLVSDPNLGNFLALLKYLDKFDPAMREHLDSVSGETGCLHTFLQTLKMN